MGACASRGREKRAFTDSQIRVLKMTWPVITNHEHVGRKVFETIFQIDPHIKSLFPFRDLSDEELVKDPVFIEHSNRFLRAVGSVVDEAQDPVVIRCILHGLGSKHAYNSAFCPIAFDVFITAMLSVWESVLKDDYNPETHDAWLAVFRLIGYTMKQGYQHSVDIQRLKN